VSAEDRIERYAVTRRGPIVDVIREALEASGARILSAPSPDIAPFEFTIETPKGERLSLICYAFLANKYTQGGRPSDEHRFQVKYGSDFQRYHRIFIDPSRRRITLMFGVHLEEKLFIAVDPAMHNPTWFSRSVEFKTADLEAARTTGWHGWERDRSKARRKLILPLESNQTEILLGLTPESFLRYVELERVATGLDAGERLLLVDNMRKWSPTASALHRLERQFGLSAREILDLIGGAFRLEAAVKGSVAEHHLERHLRTVEGVSKIERIDQDAKPDFRIVYRGEPYTIECKNVLRKLAREGPRVDFQKTRASKSDPCSRYYRRDAFDLLAACLHPVTEHWEYRFCCTSKLAPHPRCQGRLSERVLVAGDIWTPSISGLLDVGCGT
jgi:hypothetical protein